jgi:protein-L-isoaspartate(D-aspartate) O-methyltransferase
VTTAHAPNAGLASAKVRDRMVARVRELGVQDARVLAALAAVPRHAFVDDALASRAYEDTALPIGHGQTISQPYIVARTAELALHGIADPGQARLLEIGTGCGYAAAVLAHLFGQVVTIERIKALHERARANLRPLRRSNLRLLYGDGTAGAVGAAPYDVIVAAAAAEYLPPAWVAQLKVGGRIVAPLGGAQQSLTVLAKNEQGEVTRCSAEAVRFVPIRLGQE